MEQPAGAEPRPGADASVHRFGPFVLDVANRRLWRGGDELTLRARAFDVLTVLVRRAGALVTKADLLDAVWAELAVEENNLQVQVSSLRRVLGPGWLTTVPGRGYRFTADAAPAGRPSSAVPSLAGSPIPGSASTIVGRDAELGGLVAACAASRLVSLVGPGGVGKTRLAQEAARRLQDAFPGGVHWIDLAALAEPQLLVEHVAAAAGVPGASERDAAGALIEWLRPREVLLVLDNGEHVIAALAALVDRLLSATGATRLLVTSQAPCRITGEHVHRLGTLAVPPEDASLEAIAASPAVQLFVERARALVGAFDVDASNAAVVADLCRRLDGLPLALEIAAGRLPALGLTALAGRLDARFRLLTAGSRAAPPRQQSLEAVFDWSHGLLEADEQAVFRRLGLLGSTFALEDAIAIGADGVLDEWSVVEILGDLVDRSLVVTTAGDPPRYSLLDSGRAYARSRLDPDRDRIHVERALRLWRQRAVDAAARSAHGEALSAATAALELIAFLPPSAKRDDVELDLCLSLGPVVQTAIGPAHPRAEAIYRRATALAAALHDDRAFMARWGLWHFLSMVGRDRDAEAASRDLVALAAEIDDDALRLEAEHARLTTAQLLGDAGAVVESASLVIALYDPGRHGSLGARFGGHDAAVCALGQVSIAFWLAGRPDDAAEMAGRAIAAGAARPDAYSRGVALFYAAFTWHERGDRAAFDAATADLFALCETHAMDMLRNEAALLWGRARWDRGEAAGIAEMARALDAIDAGGDYAFAIYYATLLAEAFVAAGLPADALERLARVAVYARDGQRFFAPEATRLRGEALAAGGRIADARAAFQEAIGEARALGSRGLLLRAALSADAHAAPDGRAAARTELAAASALVSGGQATRDVAAAVARLSAPG